MSQSGTVASRHLTSRAVLLLSLFTGLFILFTPSYSSSAPLSLDGNGGWVDARGRTAPPLS